MQVRSEDADVLIHQDSDSLLKHFTLLHEQHLLSTKKILPTLCPASFKLLLSGIGGVAGVPAIEPAINFAGHNRPLGYVLGASVFIALGLLNTWAILDYSRYIEILDVTKHKKFSVTQLSVASISLMTGIIAAIPTTFISYRFNNNNIYFATLAFFLDTVTGTCAINQYIRSAIITTKYLHQHELMQKRNQLIEMLNNGVAARLHKSSSDEQLELDLNDPEEIIISILLDAQETHLRKEENYQAFYGLGRACAKYSNLFSPLPWGIVTTNLMYDAFLLYLSESPFVAFPLALLTAVPGYLLESGLGSELLLRLYDNSMYIKHGMYQYEPGEYYHPYIVNGGRVFGLILTSFCFGAKATVINQVFPHSPWNQIFLGVTIPAIVLFKTSAIQILFSKISNFTALKIGTVDKREMAALYAAVQDFTVVLANASPEEISAFIDKIELRLTKLSTPKNDLTLDEQTDNPRLINTNITFFKQAKKNVAPELLESKASKRCSCAIL